MTTEADNQAFPLIENVSANVEPLTKREYFAWSVFRELLKKDHSSFIEAKAQKAVYIADEFIKALNEAKRHNK